MKIGCIGFGGPAGQIALMHRILVDEKKWVDEQRYLHALNFCMLLPGPEAQKLATYVLFGEVEEMRAGPLRWYAFDLATLDFKAVALALAAAVLAFRLHRGLVEMVVAMAVLGIAVRLIFGG